MSVCLFIHHVSNVSILVWETAAPLCCYWLGRWPMQLDSPRLIYLCYVMFGWSPYINLMLYSISALHTSFYNLHQFVYLDSHAHAKCLLHIGLLMNIPVAQGHISDGPSRYKLQGHQLRFSIRLKTHLLVIIYYCPFFKHIKLNL